MLEINIALPWMFWCMDYYILYTLLYEKMEGQEKECWYKSKSSDYFQVWASSHLLSLMLKALASNIYNYFRCGLRE